MKKGFTLAEVLITLAIIGVVAALTIPVVMAKFQQKELYTRFIVAYNTFNDVYVQLKADGLMDYTGEFYNFGEVLNRLKYTIRCESGDTECYGGQKVLYKTVAHRESGDFYHYIDANCLLYSLPNGTDFCYAANHQIHFADSSYVGIPMVKIDTNGIKKGPNEYGRDYFVFGFYPYQNSLGFFNSDSYANFDEFENSKAKLMFADISTLKSGCNTSASYSYGYTCAARMLIEGKMDY